MLKSFILSSDSLLFKAPLMVEPEFCFTYPKETFTVPFATCAEQYCRKRSVVITTLVGYAKSGLFSY